jgi:PAS domain S-box-containing protein
MQFPDSISHQKLIHFVLRMDRESVRHIYRIAVTALGLTSLLVGAWLAPPGLPQWIPVLILTFFAAILVIFPLDSQLNEINLLQVVTLGIALISGPVAAGLASVFGVLSGWAVRRYWIEKISNPVSLSRELPAAFSASQASFVCGAQNTALFLAWGLSGWKINWGANLSGAAYMFALWPLVLFAILHGGLYLADLRLQDGKGGILRRSFVPLAVAELMPIPLVILAAMGYGGAGILSLIVLVGVPALFSVMMTNMSSARADLARRVEELYTLNQISQILHSTSDLDHLLAFIHLQVSQYLGIENFYVALLDPEKEQIWYPLAYKQGILQHWPPRALMDRLTDRVIRNRQPILLPRHARDEIARIGLPSSSDPLNAWMGVPLISSARAIGCLAVFSLHPETEFSEDDLEMLMILSGQVSVAVENAALGKQLQGQAEISGPARNLPSVLNSVKDGILIVEKTGVIQLANPSFEQIAGMHASEFQGKHILSLPEKILAVLGYTQPEVEELSRALVDGQTLASSKVTVTIAGEQNEQVFERSLTPVWGQDKTASGCMIMLRDMTEEAASAQSRDLMMETLVHDLRSPVSAVLGALDVIAEASRSDGAGDKDISAEALLIARRGTQRLLGLIEALLEIDRLQSGKLEIITASTDIYSLADLALLEFIPQSRELGIRVCNKIPRDLPPVKVDADKITRVFTNLLDNALKFTPSGGVISIGTGSGLRDKELTVWVSDCGPGIPEEYRQKIFERFTQIPGQRGRRRGSGLGLTFCQLAVEAHGGRIWVEPALSGGSKFTFTLPCE